jgi:integrase
VRDVLGHSNVTTTALYLHGVDERKRRAARRLELS